MESVGETTPGPSSDGGVAAVLGRLGGIAVWGELRAAGVSRQQLRHAVSGGEVVRQGRGRYALATADEHLALAHALTGVLSHTSAALRHGWKVKTPPEQAHVVVRRDRRLRDGREGAAVVRYRDLSSDDLRHGVTAPLRTVLDCARDLPFDEALAVADSALRSRDLEPHQLRVAARALQGPGAARARRVAEHASALAANPFESVLRALALDCGLAVVPQHQIWEDGLWATVDVADPALRLALEAESLEFHADRRSLRRDTHRYDVLAVFGWTVLRFTWEHVMLHPEFVRWALVSWVRAQEGHVPAAPPVLPAWHG